jgi:hypothetical protein
MSASVSVEAALRLQLAQRHLRGELVDHRDHGGLVVVDRRLHRFVRVANCSDNVFNPSRNAAARCASAGQRRALQDLFRRDRS